ncbi:cytochrome P450 [Xylaria nigripes]|nr:cytochrome P450 [Xylaria nigripes]
MSPVLVLVVAQALTGLILLFVLIAVSYEIYALYLHPLRIYPGPKLSAISRIPYWIACLKGDQVRWLYKLHRDHGPVVRFGPNDLSYAEGRAWRDICFVSKSKKENGKHVELHAPPINGVPNLIAQSDATHHAVVRRPLFQKYADLMLAIGHKATEVDMAKLLNFTSFDFMAEFTFGESLHLVLSLIQMIEIYPLVRNIFHLLEPKAITRMRTDHSNHTVTQKQDLWNLVLESEALPLDEMHINAELFVSAGTESIASVLTGLTYHLFSNSDKLQALTDEVRGRFKSSLREGSRVYLPIPSRIPRVNPEGGNVVLGKWLPAGTYVSVHQYSTYRSPENFRHPNNFAPERWLGGPTYKDDNRDAHQPFSVGPRICLGMNMAWHEMRLPLAKLLYEFDIEPNVGPEWIDQKVYVIWDRKPLICRLKGAAPWQ